MPVALAGKITFFSGEFGGSDGRRPIDAKTKTPTKTTSSVTVSKPTASPSPTSVD